MTELRPKTTMFSVFFYKLPAPFIYIMIPKNGWYKLLIINKKYYEKTSYKSDYN